MMFKRKYGGIIAPLALLLLLATLTARQITAQQGDGERSQYANMEHVSGEVTAISGTTISVRTEEGKTVQVVTTTNTRVMRGRGNVVKLTELKVGDGLLALGNLDGPNGTLHAAMVFSTDAAQVKAMKENLGKTYIAGRITAIDNNNATLTIERPDHVSQTIGLDENTSFRRGGRAPGQGAAPAGSGQSGGESITLADLKVGDMIRGTGALKNGVFIPAQVVVLPAGAGQGPHHRTDATTPPA